MHVNARLFSLDFCRQSSYPKMTLYRIAEYGSAISAERNQ